MKRQPFDVTIWWDTEEPKYTVFDEDLKKLVFKYVKVFNALPPIGYLLEDWSIVEIGIIGNHGNPDRLKISIRLSEKILPFQYAD